MRTLRRQREKTLTCFCPFCGAKMALVYDGTGSGWERSTDLPKRCPKNHDLSMRDEIVLAADLREMLHIVFDQRARDGVGDDDRRPGE